MNPEKHPKKRGPIGLHAPQLVVPTSIFAGDFIGDAAEALRPPVPPSLMLPHSTVERKTPPPSLTSSSFRDHRNGSGRGSHSRRSSYNLQRGGGYHVGQPRTTRTLREEHPQFFSDPSFSSESNSTHRRRKHRFNRRPQKFENGNDDAGDSSTSRNENLEPGDEEPGAAARIQSEEPKESPDTQENTPKEMPENSEDTILPSEMERVPPPTRCQSHRGYNDRREYRPHNNHYDRRGAYRRSTPSISPSATVNPPHWFGCPPNYAYAQASRFLRGVECSPSVIVKPNYPDRKIRGSFQPRGPAMPRPQDQCAQQRHRRPPQNVPPTSTFPPMVHHPDPLRALHEHIWACQQQDRINMTIYMANIYLAMQGMTPTTIPPPGNVLPFLNMGMGMTTSPPYQYMPFMGEPAPYDRGEMSSASSLNPLDSAGNSSSSSPDIVDPTKIGGPVKSVMALASQKEASSEPSLPSAAAVPHENILRTDTMPPSLALEKLLLNATKEEKSCETDGDENSSIKSAPAGIRQRPDDAMLILNRRFARNFHVMSGEEAVLYDLFISLRQSEDTRIKKMRLCREIDVMLRKCLLPQVNYEFLDLHVVGSSITELGRDDSDLDLCMMVSTREITQRSEGAFLLKKASSILSKQRGIEVVNKDLIHARIPLLKFRDQSTKILVDLNCNNYVGIQNSALLLAYAEVDWRVRPLVFLIKLWASKKGINNPSMNTISSYSLSLMAINYLQCGFDVPVLPCLHKLYPNYFNEHRLIEDPRALLTHFNVPKTPNRSSLLDLLRGFFDYYGFKFNYAENAVSVRLGGVIPVADCRSRLTPKNSPDQWNYICVEEPFDQTNTARAVYEHSTFLRILNLFKDAHAILTAGPMDEERLGEFLARADDGASAD